MQITYATTHKWTKDLTDHGWDAFGKNSIAKIKSTLKKVETSSVTHEFKLLDQAFLDLFLPVYERRVSEKNNPTVFDIASKLHAKRQYFSLSLYEDEQFLGGTIFSLPNNERCSFAYRTYAHKWSTANLKAKPSLYAEYLVCQHALDQNISHIVHGRDRNPYGLNSNIGLAGFKLSVGCKPFKTRSAEVKTIESTNIKTDALIFEYPGETNEIKKGYLITARETEEKWDLVKKYPHIVEIETIYRD